jgi:benzoyl-CoA reductase/2-hydroxyglutaryl-CoA dehydratase subunit BcrC/BadD/HgdB
MGAEEIIRFKDETIAQLKQIKDKMKEKLDAAKQENAMLKEEIEKLKQEGTTPAPQAVPVAAENNLILGKIEELFGIIVDKLDDILTTTSPTATSTTTGRATSPTATSPTASSTAIISAATSNS